MCLFAESCPTLCNPVDDSPPGSFVHGHFPGKNTGVGCYALLQRIFPTQGLNPGLTHRRQILYCLNHQGSPFVLINTKYTYKKYFNNSEIYISIYFKFYIIIIEQVKKQSIKTLNTKSCFPGGLFLLCEELSLDQVKGDKDYNQLKKTFVFGNLLPQNESCYMMAVTITVHDTLTHVKCAKEIK